MPVSMAQPAALDTVTAPNGIDTTPMSGSAPPEASGAPAAMQPMPSLTEWQTPIKSATYRAAELLR